MDMTKPHKGKIENWSIVMDDDDAYKAPELKTMCCVGVYGGKPWKTSYIIEGEGKEIETKNSRYTLGVPSIYYVNWMRENYEGYDLFNPFSGQSLKRKKR